MTDRGTPTSFPVRLLSRLVGWNEAHSSKSDEMRAQHECQRCGSDEWEYVDYGGCSDCRPYEKRVDPEDIAELCDDDSNPFAHEASADASPLTDSPGDVQKGERT